MSDTVVRNEIANDFAVAQVSVNATIDNDRTVTNDAGELGQGDLNDQSSQEEITFYSKFDCYKFRLKFAEKAMRSLDYYQKIFLAVQQSAIKKALNVLIWNIDANLSIHIVAIS